MAQEQGVEEAEFVLRPRELGVAGVEELRTGKFTEEALEILAAAEGRVAGVGGSHLRRANAECLWTISLIGDFLLHGDVKLHGEERRYE